MAFNCAKYRDNYPKMFIFVEEEHMMSYNES